MPDKIIIANWKMHKTVAETFSFLEAFAREDVRKKSWIAPPFTALYPASQYIKRHELDIVLGGQNMHDLLEGSYTGEISASMLQDVGARFCILGHSERRKFFAETGTIVQKKRARAFANGLTAVICCGEGELARGNGNYMAEIEGQIASALEGMRADDARHLILAYEPVWAIGTGRAATPDIVQEVHGRIRAYLSMHLKGVIAATVPLLYGGSVNEKNATSFMQQPDIDGLLVGKASLEAKSFAAILREASI
jgi:triosephosphate isomerase